MFEQVQNSAFSGYQGVAPITTPLPGQNLAATHGPGGMGTPPIMDTTGNLPTIIETGSQVANVINAAPGGPYIASVIDSGNGGPFLSSRASMQGQSSLSMGNTMLFVGGASVNPQSQAVDFDELGGINNPIPAKDPGSVGRKIRCEDFFRCGETKDYAIHLSSKVSAAKGKQISDNIKQKYNEIEQQRKAWKESGDPKENQARRNSQPFPENAQDAPTSNGNDGGAGPYGDRSSWDYISPFLDILGIGAKDIKAVNDDIKAFVDACVAIMKPLCPSSCPISTMWTATLDVTDAKGGHVGEGTEDINMHLYVQVIGKCTMP